MKTLLFQRSCCVRSLIRIALPLLLALGMQTAMASAKSPIQDTIVINKNQANKKYKVRLYPNATHEVLFFTAAGEDDKIYQLFLFDMESNLIKQTMVRNRQTSFLSRFSKGEYLYEVFSNDERIENGSVSIK